MPLWVPSQEAINLWPNASLESGIDDWRTQGQDVTLSHSNARSKFGTWSLKAACASTGNNNWSTVDYFTVLPGTEYTWSAYFLLDEDAPGADLNVFIVDFDFNNLTGFVDVTLIDETWVRFELTFTTLTSTKILTSMQEISGVDTPGDIYMDGVMLELGGTMSDWVDHG